MKINWRLVKEKKKNIFIDLVNFAALMALIYAVLMVIWIVQYAPHFLANKWLILLLGVFISFSVWEAFWLSLWFIYAAISYAFKK